MLACSNTPIYLDQLESPNFFVFQNKTALCLDMLSQICSWCYFTDFPKNYTRGEFGLVEQLFCLEQVFIAELYFSQKYKRNTDRSAALVVWAGAAILNYFLLNWFSNLKLVIFVLLWFSDRDLLKQAKYISFLVIPFSSVIILKISVCMQPRFWLYYLFG